MPSAQRLYLQGPKIGNHPSVHQQVHGQTDCGVHTGDHHLAVKGKESLKRPTERWEPAFTLSYELAYQLAFSEVTRMCRISMQSTEMKKCWRQAGACPERTRRAGMVFGSWGVATRGGDPGCANLRGQP